MWNPPVEPSRAEQVVIKAVRRAKLLCSSVSTEPRCRMVVFAVVGQSASFVLAGLLIQVDGLSRAVLVLALGPLAGAVLIAIRFPETGGRELEAIAAELTSPDAT